MIYLIRRATGRSSDSGDTKKVNICEKRSGVVMKGVYLVSKRKL